MTVLDAGATIRVENELPTTELWGQLENRGGELETSSIVFSLLAPSGQQIWSGRYPDIRWLAGERKRTRMEYPTADSQPGDYLLRLAVTSANGRSTLASLERPVHISLDR